MALVKFVAGTAAQFQNLSPKDADTLYFITDERRIYKGDIPYSGGIYQTVAAFPETGDAVVNTLYVNTATGEVAYFNGTNMQTVVPATGKTISGAGDDTHLATTKAIVDYVTAQIADLDVSALKGRVGTLETEMDTAQGDITTIKGQITTINGEGEGSIKKAASEAQTAAIAAAKAYTDQETAKKANLEHTHEIDDVTGLQDALDGKANAVHTHTTAQVDGLDAALAGKADKATTLAGYGITDAYTTSQTDSKIAEAIAAVDHLKREIVESLPEVESADENTIYMVPQGGSIEDPGASTSHYNEYMLINGAFELIGSSQVDLSGYATETFVTNAINALDVADAAVANQYVSQVVETDGKIAVTRAELPVKSVTEGSANGTIAVNDVDVNVHGLGSAAYTEASAYEVAGAAAAAVATLDKTDSAQEGQYVSAVSQENGIITVTRAQLPAAATLVEGTAKGTVKFNGTDVPVHGLGSAAYTESGAYATAAQGALADTALQEADITTGATQGTIAVDGTDVAVNGLKSAAFAETTAFDAAGAADQALTNAKAYVDAALTWGSLA